VITHGASSATATRARRSKWTASPRTYTAADDNTQPQQCAASTSVPAESARLQQCAASTSVPAKARQQGRTAIAVRGEHDGAGRKDAQPQLCAASTTVPARATAAAGATCGRRVPTGRGRRQRTALAVRGEHQGAGQNKQTARTPGSRQSAEHGVTQCGVVQRHVQERQGRAQPTHPRGTYHREAADLRSAARDSSQNGRGDRRDTQSRRLSRRVPAKCPRQARDATEDRSDPITEYVPIA
jgi:hypothetical protein